MTGGARPPVYVPPETLWRSVHRQRRRLIFTLWTAASVAAVLLATVIRASVPLVATAAFLGAVIGIAMPWVASWLAGARSRRAVRVFGRHLGWFRTPIDRMLAAGEIDAARTAIDGLAAQDPWARFEVVRLRSRLASTIGAEPPDLTEMRQAAASLAGLDRIKADLEIIVLEAAALASFDGDWNAHLEAAVPLVYRSSDPLRTRLFGLTIVTVWSSAVVAGGATILAVIAALLGIHAP